MKEELETAKTKLRWERRQNGYGEEEDKDEIGEKEKEELEILELRTREIYDQENGSLDMRKRRATDVKSNQRVYLPGPRPAREEAELLVRSQRLENQMLKFMKEYCNERGELRESNLSEQEKRGLKKLLKRVKDKEIVVNVTDKSGKLCVTSMESYIRQGNKHINGDREVSWEEIVTIQRRVTAHARVIVKIFNIGEEWGEENQKRVNAAYSTQAGVVPVLSTMVKDHKPLEGEEPKTRPVCGCNTSVNGRLSELASDILAPVAIAQENECQSSEEMIYYLGEAAKVIKEKGKNVVVASEDVDGLYPNIDINHSAVICGDAVRETRWNK